MAGGARDAARRWRIAGLLGLLVALALVVVFAVGLHRWWYLAVAAYWVAQGGFWLRAGRRRQVTVEPEVEPAPAGEGPAGADAAGDEPARRVRDPAMIQGAAAYGRAFGYIADREARREAAARHEAELVERARKVTERDAELRAELAAFLAEQAAETLRREQAEAQADAAARAEAADADGTISPPR